MTTENVIPMRRNLPTLTSSQESTAYTLWLRLDAANFTPVVDNGVLQLQDRHDPPRSVSDLTAWPEAARIVKEVADFGPSLVAAYIANEGGELKRIEVDPPAG